MFASEVQREIDLGNGLTTFRFGEGKAVALDLVGWVRWYSSDAVQAMSYDKRLDAARERLHYSNLHMGAAELTDTQIDALLHALVEEFQSLKKKQKERLTSLSSTE